MKDEALKLALEALELSAVTVDSFGVQRKTQEAITAIKQALAAPVQEKWGLSAVMNPDYVAAQKEKAQQALDVMAENARELGLDYEPVWDNLPSNKDVEDAMRMKRLNQLATPPAAQRTWVGLTDEERNTIGRHHAYVDNIIRATEAKLKEKNT